MIPIQLSNEQKRRVDSLAHLRIARAAMLRAWESSGEGVLGPISNTLKQIDTILEGKPPKDPNHVAVRKEYIGVDRGFVPHPGGIDFDGQNYATPTVKVYFRLEDWFARDDFARILGLSLHEVKA